VKWYRAAIVIMGAQIRFSWGLDKGGPIDLNV
jgi:hypothetical protein